VTNGLFVAQIYLCDIQNKFDHIFTTKTIRKATEIEQDEGDFILLLLFIVRYSQHCYETFPSCGAIATMVFFINFIKVMMNLSKISLSIPFLSILYSFSSLIYTKRFMKTDYILNDVVTKMHQCMYTIKYDLN
jgi:hypothetical protein